MSSRTSSPHPSDLPGGGSDYADGGDGRFAPRPRTRSGQAVAYVAATALGGLGALVVMAMELVSGDGAVLDVLLWAALAVFLFGAAAHRWWLGGRNEERSRRIAAAIRPHQLASAVDGSAGEVDAVRRLRVSHPGLGLRDAVELVRGHAGSRPAQERIPDGSPTDGGTSDRGTPDRSTTDRSTTDEGR